MPLDVCPDDRLRALAAQICLLVGQRLASQAVACQPPGGGVWTLRPDTWAEDRVARLLAIEWEVHMSADSGHGKGHVQEHANQGLKAIEQETDLRKAIRMALQGGNNMVRTGLVASRDKAAREHAVALEECDVADSLVEPTVDAILANTGHK